MDVKQRILDAAAELVASSEDVDISTRAVCEAANVSAPSLYHHFGDKEGLLAAIVEFGWTQFLESKHSAMEGLPASVAAEVRASWDNHLEFACENPNLYRLMWSPAVSRTSAASEKAHDMARQVMERGAQRGELRVSVESATRMAMATVTGAALSLTSQPELFADGTFADQMRETLIAAITVEPPPAQPPARAPSLQTLAATLSSKLRTEPTPLREAERALMQQWLTAIADKPASIR